jgi:hypothetical protein
VAQHKAAQHEKHVDGEVTFIEDRTELVGVERGKVDNYIMEADDPDCRYAAQRRQRL